MSTTETHRVYLIDLHRVSGNIFDLTFVKRTRPAKPKEPDVPANHDFAVSANGFLAYRDGENLSWVCHLSDGELPLIQAILNAQGGCIYGDDAFKALGLDIWLNAKKMKSILGGINRKLSKAKVPVKLSIADWQFRFVDRKSGR